MCARIWLMILCSMVFGCGQAATAGTDLYEKAQYHIRELGKTLKEIETFHKIRKRSASAKENGNELVESLRDICSKLYDTTKSPELEKPPTSGSSNSSGSGEIASVEKLKRIGTQWSLPDPFPLKVKAKRDGDKVKVEFEVAHSSIAYVSQAYSFDHPKKVIGVPKDKTGELVESGVSIDVDASRCVRNKYSSNNLVTFLIASEGHGQYHTQVRVDVCRFDVFWNETKNHDGDYQKKSDDDILYSEILPLPKFRVLSGETIFIQKGKNPVIDVKMRVLKGDSYGVYVNLWDWNSKKFVIDSIHVGLSNSDTEGIHVTDHYGNKEGGKANNILKLEVVEETVVVPDENNDGSEEGEELKRVDAEVRITVEIGSKEMSGQLGVFYSNDDNDWKNPKVLDGFSVEEIFSLKLPYKISVYPSNTVYMKGDTLKCDEGGNKNRRSQGKNCTISCYAHGTDIQSIFIIKTYPYRLPVRSSSSVIGARAFAIQDVGPASEENDGVYRCTVITKNGKMKSADINLYTGGLTNVTNFKLEDLGNSTSRVECTVYGAPPLNISIVTNVMDGNSSTEERIDNAIGAVTTHESLDDKTTKLTLLICNEYLQYPRVELYCKASGARGESSSYVHLSADLVNNYNPYIPEMIDEESTVQKSKDGLTTTISCMASASGESMDMFVSYGAQNKRFRIDKKPEYDRSITEMGDVVLLTLTVPTRSIVRPYSWLYCGVENEFGYDWKRFFLPTYGVDD